MVTRDTAELCNLEALPKSTKLLAEYGDAERAELNDRKAEGDERHTMAFCVWRAEEAEAEARRAERILSGKSDPWQRGVSEEERVRQEGFRDAARERAAYWRGLTEAKGGVKFGKDALRPGMEVLIRRTEGEPCFSSA